MEGVGWQGMQLRIIDMILIPTFTVLQSGEVDVLTRNLTPTMARDTPWA